MQLFSCMYSRLALGVLPSSACVHANLHSEDGTVSSHTFSAPLQGSLMILKRTKVSSNQMPKGVFRKLIGSWTLATTTYVQLLTWSKEMEE